MFLLLECTQVQTSVPQSGRSLKLIRVPHCGQRNRLLNTLKPSQPVKNLSSKKAQGWNSAGEKLVLSRS